MKISCTGATGRVGRLLVKQGVVPLSCDITKPEEVVRAIDTESPDVVLHLAGISDVDYCEVPEHWQEVVTVNFRGTINVAKACEERDIPVGYVSSEHVFSGKSFLGFGGGPYLENHPVNTVGCNNYALTKIACEGLRYAYPNMKIVRTSYLFDWVRLMTEELVEAHDSRPTLYHYPTFIHRSYIYLPHFAQNLKMYADNIDFMPTVLHLAGSKTVSQYQFMRDFVRYFHVQGVSIRPRHKEYPTGDNVPLVASRPHRAGLDVQRSRKLGFPLYSYKDGFKQMEADTVRG